MKNTYGWGVGVAALFVAILAFVPLSARAQAYYSYYDPNTGSYVYDPYQSSYYQYDDPYQSYYSYGSYYPSTNYYTNYGNTGYYGQQYGLGTYYPGYQYGYYGSTYASPYASWSQPISANLSYSGYYTPQQNTGYLGLNLNPYNDQPYNGYGITRSYPWGDWTRCYWGNGYGYSSCNYNPAQPLFDPWTGTWY